MTWPSARRLLRRSGLGTTSDRVPAPGQAPRESLVTAGTPPTIGSY